MEFIIIYFMILLIVAIIFALIPIWIAKSRGISGSELTTIKILSWVGIILFITWVIALILSLVWKPKNWVDKENPKSTNRLEDLEKLNTLKKKGIITEDEFNAQKKLLLR